MKAAVFNSFGGPEVLHYEEVNTPEPGPNEVQVKVHAVTVNRGLDLLVREGKSPFNIAFPHILGTDPSGVVSAVGSEVESLKVGDRVSLRSEVKCGRCEGCRGNRACEHTRHIGVESWGGYAEYVVVSEGQALLIPDDVDFATASYATRHYGMASGQMRKTGVEKGDVVLVLGAAGALGTMLTQLLVELGATVIAGAGSDERIEYAKGFGAHHGINYVDNDLTAEVMRITDNEGVRVVFENVGEPNLWKAAFNSIGFEGSVVTGGYHGGGVVPLDIRRLHIRRISVLPSNAPRLKPAEEFGNAMRLAEAGALRAPIGARLPLEQAAEAHRMLEARSVPGKIVLEPWG